MGSETLYLVEFTQTILVTLSIISHLWTHAVYIRLIWFRFTSVIVLFVIYTKKEM